MTTTLYICHTPEEAARLDAARGGRFASVRFVASMERGQLDDGFATTYVSEAHTLRERSPMLVADEFRELLAFVEGERGKVGE